ncbi:hypothetical protein DA2_1487 [Desulfovibrio sp. A2]|nr:hypothetical protein DA2_1487 [Desulfovibrio sp. A2]
MEHHDKIKKVLKSFDKILMSYATRILPPDQRKYLKGKDGSDFLYVMNRYLKTMVVPVPHSVVITPTYKCALSMIGDLEIHKKSNLLINAFKTGNPILNKKGLSKADRFVTDNNFMFFDKSGCHILDFLSYGASIRHFHIGYNKGTDDTLAYVIVMNNEAHFLTIASHSDIYIESGGNVVFNALLNEYPYYADRIFYKVKSGTLTQPALSSNDVRMLKVSGVNSAFVDKNGDVRIPTSAISTARTPMSETMRYIKAKNEIEEYISTVEMRVRGKNIRIISIETYNKKPVIVFCCEHSPNKIEYINVIINESSAIGSIIKDIYDICTIGGFPYPSVSPKIQNKAASRKNNKRTNCDAGR